MKVPEKNIEQAALQVALYVNACHGLIESVCKKSLCTEEEVVKTHMLFLANSFEMFGKVCIEMSKDYSKSSARKPDAEVSDGKGNTINAYRIQADNIEDALQQIKNIMRGSGDNQTDSKQDGEQ